MKRWTVDDMMALSPCYTRARVVELWGPRRGLTALDILDLDIPAQDRLWALWRVLPETERAQAIDLTVERAVMTHCVACGVPAVEAWAQAWLSGEDRSATAASAATAANSAATAANSAASAAYHAAYRAAKSADCAADAAYYAANAAYYAANAAYYAADAAYTERNAQLADIREVLTTGRRS